MLDWFRHHSPRCVTWHPDSTKMYYPRLVGMRVAIMTAIMREAQPRAGLRVGLPFVVLGVGLGGLLIAAGNRVYIVQGGMAEIASLLPLGYAFGAGMVATVNPCGVLLLPSLVAYYLSSGSA